MLTNMSPLLVFAFTNDFCLCPTIKHSICNIFSGNLSVCQTSMIQAWMLENKLRLNTDKTEALLLHSSSKSFSVSKPTTISVCGCEISFFFFCQKSWFLHQRWHERRTTHKEHLPAGLLWFQLTVQKHLCPPLSSLGLIVVTCSSQVALNHLLEKLQKVQNSAARLALKAHKRDHV